MATTNTKTREVFGHSATSVMRWMGKHGWKFAAAKRAFAGAKVKVSDGTIRQQLFAGRKGTRGEPAKVTKADAKALKALGAEPESDAEPTKAKAKAKGAKAKGAKKSAKAKAKAAE